MAEAMPLPSVAQDGYLFLLAGWGEIGLGEWFAVAKSLRSLPSMVSPGMARTRFNRMVVREAKDDDVAVVYVGAGLFGFVGEDVIALRE